MVMARNSQHRYSTWWSSIAAEEWKPIKNPNPSLLLITANAKEQVSVKTSWRKVKKRSFHADIHGYSVCIPHPSKQGLSVWAGDTNQSWEWGAGWAQHSEHPRLNLGLLFHLTSECPSGEMGEDSLRRHTKAFFSGTDASASFTIK